MRPHARFFAPIMLGATLAAALALAGCSKKADDTAATKPAAPIANVAPPPGKAWTDVVSTTPEGGTVIGNPNAPVKLIEYAAFTCPHCKHFEETGAPKLLADYVPSGRVSWEFRPLVIHGGPDVVPSLLIACRGAAPYFTLGQQFFAYQDEYMKKLIAVPAAEQERWSTLPPAEQFKTIARSGGLYPFFGARGLTPAAADACLSDQKALDAFTAAQQTASQLGVNSTPTFLLNGRLLDGVSVWDKLEPELKTALG